MIRWFLPLLLLLAGPAHAAPRDWTSVVTQTPAGIFVQGNPAAKVRLVEYLSYTCPHCAAFTAESAPVLKGQMVRSGSTSIEYRNTIHEQIDLAAALLARCAGSGGFVPVTEAMFARQDEWYAQATRYLDFNAARIADYPVPAQLRAIALGSGLANMVRGRWLTPAAFDACFADRRQLDLLIKLADDAGNPTHATPTFVLAGKTLVGLKWPGLEPLLRAAGAH